MSRAPHPAGVIARYVVLGAGLGLAVGLLWAWRAPRVVVRSLAEADFVDPYPQGFAVADLTLGALLLVAGAMIGMTAGVRLRRTAFAGGWSQVVGALVATGVCAAVARVAGWWTAGRAVTTREDATFALPLSVGANGVLLLAAFSALLVIIMVAAFSRDQVTSGSVPSAPS